jgi:hypothetical protein
MGFSPVVIYQYVSPFLFYASQCLVLRARYLIKLLWTLSSTLYKLYEGKVLKEALADTNPAFTDEMQDRLMDTLSVLAGHTTES